MQNTPIEATIFYRHRAGETDRLKQAIVPLGDQLRAVASSSERASMRTILAGEYFRVSESAQMCRALLRTSKQTRAHLDDYFPLMHDGLIAAAEELENAVCTYQRLFTELRSTTLPAE